MAITLVVILVGLVVIDVIYSPYMFWFFIVPGAQIEVDGKPVEGWLHRGRRGEVLFVTRHDQKKAETYRIWAPRDGRGVVSSCDDWTVARVPAFIVGDVNPPCISLVIVKDISRLPTPQTRILVAGTGFVEFTADDHKRVRVSW